jgi:hypothetical protein
MVKAFIMNGLLALVASSQVIVGKRWPSPRWFLGSSSPPPTDTNVVSNGDQVVSNGVNVVSSP